MPGRGHVCVRQQPDHLELDRLPRPAQGRRLDVQAVPRGDRHRGRVQRRRQRQRRVLRQGEEPAGLLRAGRPRHVHADRLDGRADDRPRLDPAAGPEERAQPAQEPDQGAQGPRLGPQGGVPRSVAERPDRHRLQRRRGRRGAHLRGADHPLRPQGQDHPALRDAGHDGVLPEGGRRRAGDASPRTTGPTRSTCCARRSPTASCCSSRATTTSSSSRTARSSPARRGRAT